MSRHTSSITLRALEGQPLADPSVRSMVVAAAKALGERHGVDVLRVDAAPDRITCTLLADRIVAMGFAAELRRSTATWYEHKFGVAHLWGDVGEQSSWEGPKDDPGPERPQEGEEGKPLG